MSECPSNDVKTSTIANSSDESDLEKQRGAQPSASEPSASDADDHTRLTIVVSTGEPKPVSEVPTTTATRLSHEEESPGIVSPKKELLSMASSSDEQCRICQQEKEEALIELGCQCRGGLAKAHRTCIDTWFRTKGSNRCEICQVIAANVSPPQSHHGTNYWIWRIDPTYRTQDPERVKAALLQSTLVGFCYPHRGSAIGCSYINYPRCFCIACKYHHRSHCGAWTWNRVSTCARVLPGVEFNKRVAESRIEHHYWVLSSYIVSYYFVC
ncbi:uncharacterized protein LOC111026101 isoform X1 [Momordica charantia]|uniref:Uncharacterized protein LOC111026101 isoform X1 n=1 Tax=Momordica charantia TaxID=3673 RepID=A0A6J1DZU1_MOMCH|nr:uncharacterized protein LOC111026101 isoform X1 [Momordica charantia]XP_022159783.1 uncharacterized protein LOC111026101 isoform X1 [Momordica charantia]